MLRTSQFFFSFLSFRRTSVEYAKYMAMVHMTSATSTRANQPQPSSLDDTDMDNADKLSQIMVLSTYTLCMWVVTKIVKKILTYFFFIRLSHGPVQWLLNDKGSRRLLGKKICTAGEEPTAIMSAASQIGGVQWTYTISYTWTVSLPKYTNYNKWIRTTVTQSYKLSLKVARVAFVIQAFQQMSKWISPHEIILSPYIDMCLVAIKTVIY